MSAPGDVSVIIPLYNKAATAARAIRSALEQDVRAEVVVVDDGSTDGSGEVARSFGDAIVYVRQANAGPSVARNRGVQVATQPILAFLDADDEYLPGCLAAHLDCRRARPGTTLTYAPFRLLARGADPVEDDLVSRVGGFVRAGRYSYTERFHPALTTWVASDSICVDRSVFLEVGGFDPRLRAFEISDFLFRTLVRRPVVGVLDRTYVVIHGDSDTSQFARAGPDIANQVVRSDNILDHLAHVPEEHRPHFLALVEGCLAELLARGEAEDFRRLSRRLERPVRAGLASRSMHFLGHTPDACIRAAGLVLRMRSRIGRALRGAGLR